MGTDGSEASDLAFNVVCKDMFREEIDHIVVGHVTDRKKDYLPWNMRPQFVSDCYESKMIQLGSKGRYAPREKEEAKTSKEMLWDIADFEKASLICVGSHGRKGPKGDLTVAGTAIEYLSLNSKYPCLIIKDRKARSEKPDGCLRYAVLYDGSERAKEVLELTLKIMQTKDKLMTISVTEPKMASKDVITHHIKSRAEEFGVTKVECIQLEHEEGKSVY